MPLFKKSYQRRHKSRKRTCAARSPSTSYSKLLSPYESVTVWLDARKNVEKISNLVITLTFVIDRHGHEIFKDNQTQFTLSSSI